MRAAVRERRRARSETDRSKAREALAERLVELVLGRGARTVSCFLPTPSEPDTSGFLAWAADHGVEVLLPVSSPGNRLEWVRSHGAEAEPGAHGIRKPLGERLPETAVGAVDLMLIPACAVDARGFRLGWGRGYYDRCLAALESPPPVFAVVFDDEVLPRVPTEPHDMPVTGYVSPSGAACPASAARRSR